MVGHLGQHNEKVKDPQCGGNGDAEEFLQNQRRNIHTAGGSAAPQHHAKAQSQTHTGEQRVQEQIVGDKDIAQRPVQNFQRDGVEKGTDNGGHGKCPAQDPPAKAEHDDIEHQNKAGNGNSQMLVHHQGDTGGAAADQIGRQQEKLDGAGIKAVSYQHQKQLGQFIHTGLIHGNTRRDTKNTSVKIFPNRRGSRLSPNTTILYKKP